MGLHHSSVPLRRTGSLGRRQDRRVRTTAVFLNLVRSIFRQFCTRDSKYKEPFGQTIACAPSLGALKREAHERLAGGEGEESLRSWLAETTADQTTHAERLIGLGSCSHSIQRGECQGTA